MTPLGGTTRVHTGTKADTLLKVLLRIELLQEQLFTLGTISFIYLLLYTLYSLLFSLVIHKIVDLAQTVNMDETTDVVGGDSDADLDTCVLLLNHIRYTITKLASYLLIHSLIFLLDGVKLYTIQKH